MKALPEAFMERMHNTLGAEYDDFIRSYEEPPKRGLRVNILKTDPGEFAAICPWRLEKTGILPEGFTVLGAENVGRHPYHVAGLFYMQEPSAMSAVAACPADESGLKLLDMCAAPGGKTGGAAARMKGRGVIVANEIVPKRARLLAQNVERLGIPNAAVICERPDNIARALPEFFDVVTVDAPCSGEGMFRKDDTAILEWSPEHVASCAERQKLILESAAACVKKGGCIVYSTCTFSHEENEGVIEDFLSKHGDYSIELTERLYPHTSPGEGHFVCRLRRSGSVSAPAAYPAVKPYADRKQLALTDDFAALALKGGLPDGVLFVKNDTVRLIPHDMPEAVLSLHPVSVGVELGVLKKGRLEPSHSFFMAETGAAFLRSLEFAPDDPLLAAFLAGNTVPCPETFRGWSSVCVRAGDRAYPIGFGKAVDGVMKNHLPKGLYVN